MLKKAYQKQYSLSINKMKREVKNQRNKCGNLQTIKQTLGVYSRIQFLVHHVTIVTVLLYRARSLTIL